MYNVGQKVRVKKTGIISDIIKKTGNKFVLEDGLTYYPEEMEAIE